MAKAKTSASTSKAAKDTKSKVAKQDKALLAAEGEEIIITKEAKSDSEVKEYSVNKTYKKGETVYHKVWDDTGEVLEVGITEDGIKKVKIAFEKVGLKTLRMS
ncbi:MAG: hypothetical protein GX221_07515 [Candidatus Riflebacteria bacterium]|nr:hypothetical protein [Candidatus Riflebacteria bacterium]